MFCPLERIELKVDHCPAQRCIYKDSKSCCAYEALTQDEVGPTDIADIKAIKLYKVKHETTAAKEKIAKGMVLLRYSDFIKQTYPNLGTMSASNSLKTVNGDEGHVTLVLSNLFGLSKYQQDKLWKAQTYEEWRTKNKVNYSLNDLLMALSSATV